MRHASVKQPEQAAIRALRSDLALQIARHVAREGLTQSAAAARDVDLQKACTAPPRTTKTASPASR